MAIKNTYLFSAKEILDTYIFPEPFHLYLKMKFKENKKYGSRDRKIISALLYGLFRIGKQKIPIDEAMQIGLFLCNDLLPDMYIKCNGIFAENYDIPLAEKLTIIQKNYPTFVWQYQASKLSNGITSQAYMENMCQNPMAFIRVRKYKNDIERLLQANAVEHAVVAENTIAFAQHINFKEVLPFEESYTVQDKSSQEVCTYFSPQPNEKWWDCCAASGGKSIALFDQCNAVQIYVSDIREPILKNLQYRFKMYGINGYKVFAHDASKPTQMLNNKVGFASFDNIIADVPCTGSGTWARTPEQYYYASETDVQKFAEKQVAIVKNVLPFLKNGGCLYYITCSVFASENENVIDRLLLENKNITCQIQKNIIGFAGKADAMFIAKLVKN